MDAKSLPAINAAVDKLTTQLVGKHEELRRRESSSGKHHNVRDMTRLRTEIESLEVRLARAEYLQDSILAKHF